MGRNRWIYFAALVFAFLFFLFFSAWFSEFLLLFLLCLPLMSLLVSLPAIAAARPVLTAPAEVRRGEPAEVQVQLSCGAPAPDCTLILLVDDGMAGTRAKCRWKMGKQAGLPLPTRHSGSVRYSVSCGWMYDYLGLFRIRRRWRDTGRLLVLPVPQMPDPAPNLERLQVRAYRPLPGGGFSEVYELRDYQPGDSLRDFNWKLTAKMDKPIVREPQISNRGAVVLSMDLMGTPEELDHTLDCAVGVSQWLIRQGVAHEVRWFSGSCRQVYLVAEPEDVRRLTQALCMSEQGKLPATSLVKDASWHYHVSPGTGGEA